MEDPKIGSRVGVIQDADSDSVRFVGWGKYEGRVPFSSYGRSVTTVKIKMDCGTNIFGYQCWWGTEDEIEKILKNKKVTNVSVAEFLRELGEDA